MAQVQEICRKNKKVITPPFDVINSHGASDQLEEPDNFVVFISSHRKCSMNKAVLKNFVKFMKKHRCFPVNIAKFLRTPILNNICEGLLLDSFLSKIMIIRKQRLSGLL